MNKTWWKAAGVRALKTFCQTAVSMLTVGQAFIDVDWMNVLSVSGVAAVISLLTSIAGIPEVDFLMAQQEAEEIDEEASEDPEEEEAEEESK
jgi:hypothetical protein